jgi:hypothetical protein
MTYRDTLEAKSRDSLYLIESTIVKSPSRGQRGGYERRSLVICQKINSKTYKYSDDYSLDVGKA